MLGSSKVRSTGQGENVSWESWEKSWCWRLERASFVVATLKRSFGAAEGMSVYIVAILNLYL